MRLIIKLKTFVFEIPRYNRGGIKTASSDPTVFTFEFNDFVGNTCASGGLMILLGTLASGKINYVPFGGTPTKEKNKRDIISITATFIYCSVWFVSQRGFRRHNVPV